MKTTVVMVLVGVILALLIAGCQKQAPAGESAPETLGGESSLSEDLQDLQELDQLSDEVEDSSFSELDNLNLE